MPWDSEMYEPPAWGDRARFFVSLKMPRADVDAIKIAECLEMPREDLAKFAEAGHCSLYDAVRGITMCLAVKEKIASGEKISKSEAALLLGVEKTASVAGLTAGLTQYAPQAIGAALGAIMMGSKAYAESKQDATGSSKGEREAQHLRDLFTAKSKPGDTGYVHQLTQAYHDLNVSLSKANKDHPIAGSALNALVGAGAGAMVGGTIHAIRKTVPKLPVG